MRASAAGVLHLLLFFIKIKGIADRGILIGCAFCGSDTDINKGRQKIICIKTR